jgi:tRNA threonylcarbamoyladenosine biosynthesis protein TsaE
MEHITHSAQETMHIAAQVAGSLAGGVVVALYGELGAGKTTFVKGLAEALGITSTMVSPTFTLMQHYQLPSSIRGASEFVHIDTYRLRTATELVGIGAQEYIGSPTAIAVIEWPEKIEELLKNKNVAKIYFSHGENETERKITLA